MIPGKFVSKLVRVLVLGIIASAILVSSHLGSNPAFADTCCCGPVGTQPEADTCPITATIDCKPYPNKPQVTICTGAASGGVPPYTPYWKIDGGEWQKGSWNKVIHYGRLRFLNLPDKFIFTVTDSIGDGSCWIETP